MDTIDQPEPDRVSGCHLWSELPDWLGLDVVEGPVPDVIDGAERPVPWIQATPSAVRVQFPGSNALMVADGCLATVQWDPQPEGSVAGLDWLVQGWAMTLAALQRGHLVLHASTVHIGSEVVALAGRSGAGKSTTSMALRGRGHRLLVDDTTILDLGDSKARVMPFHRNVHLMPDAAAAVGIEFDSLPVLVGPVAKAGFLPEAPDPQPRRIDRVVVLEPSTSEPSVTLRETRGAERVSALAPHTRLREIAPIVLGRANYFALLARLSDMVQVQVLSRPAELWTLDEVLDVIEAGVNATRDDMPG